MQIGCGNRRERTHAQDLVVDGSVILKWILSEVGAWSGLMWFRIGVGGGPL